MKIFPAVVLSGAVLTAVVAGVTGYSLRSRATAGFDTSAVSNHSTGILETPRGLGPVVYRAAHCGGDYVCDEQGAWVAVYAGP
jgi:hypothetical protein